LITWVGEQVPPVKRSKAFKHKKSLQSFLTTIHIDHYATTIDEVLQISKKLQSDDFLNLSNTALPIPSRGVSTTSLDSDSESEEESTSKVRLRKRSVSSDNLQALNLEVSKQYPVAASRSLNGSKEVNNKELADELKQKEIRVGELQVQVDLQKKQIESLQQEVRAEKQKMETIHEALNKNSSIESSLVARLKKLKEINDQQKVLMDAYYKELTKSEPPTMEKKQTQTQPDSVPMTPESKQEEVKPFSENSNLIPETKQEVLSTTNNEDIKKEEGEVEVTNQSVN